MSPIYFHEDCNKYKEYTLLDSVNSQLQNRIFNIATTITYVLSPVMNFSLHAVLIKTCISGGDPQLLSPLLNCTTHQLTVLTSAV